MTEIGMDLGTEGIAEDGGKGRTLLEIHQRLVSNTLPHNKKTKNNEDNPNTMHTSCATHTM